MKYLLPAWAFVCLSLQLPASPPARWHMAPLCRWEARLTDTELQALSLRLGGLRKAWREEAWRNRPLQGTRAGMLP